MGPIPKISVRVVPEVSTSDSMRSFRSATFQSSVRTPSAGPQKLVGGGRARRSPVVVCRAGCARPEWPRAFRLSRQARGLVEARAGCLERSGALCNQVNKRLSESRRSTPRRRPRDRPAPASRCPRRPARWPGHRAHRSCGRCQRSSIAPSPLPRVWAERQPRTRLPPSTSPPGDDRGRRRSPAPRAALGEPLRPALEAPQAGVALREGSTLEELAFGFVDRRYGDRTFVGIDPDQNLHGRTYLRFGRTSVPSACAKDIPTSGFCSYTSFESLRPPRAPAGRKPRTSQPISDGRQEVGERSLCNRYPRSLAAADHPAPDRS